MPTALIPVMKVKEITDIEEIKRLMKLHFPNIG